MNVHNKDTIPVVLDSDELEKRKWKTCYTEPKKEKDYFHESQSIISMNQLRPTNKFFKKCFLMSK